MRYMGRSICRRVVELTQQRHEFNSLQRADSCFPTPLRTESLYTRILVGLKERFKACVSNAFREIFQFHIAPTERTSRVYRLSTKLEKSKPIRHRFFSACPTATSCREVDGRGSP